MTGFDETVPPDDDPTADGTTPAENDGDTSADKDEAPLTTDPEAQRDDSVVNPESS